MGASLELRNCTPLPIPSRDWFSTPNLYFLILYLQTSPTSKFQLNVCLPWIELHFLFPLQSSVSKWLCSWSVMWDLEKMFPKGACVCSPSSILLGVVMAGTWATILHSEVKAVCGGCQSSKIEETLVLKNSRNYPALYCQSSYLFYGWEKYICVLLSFTLDTPLFSNGPYLNWHNFFWLQFSSCSIAPYSSFQAKFTILLPVSLLRNPGY